MRNWNNLRTHNEAMSAHSSVAAHRAGQPAPGKGVVTFYIFLRAWDKECLAIGAFKITRCTGEDYSRPDTCRRCCGGKNQQDHPCNRWQVQEGCNGSQGANSDDCDDTADDGYRHFPSVLLIYFHQIHQISFCLLWIVCGRDHLS